MAEPTNPLFEDEKEFLERQKLEYERALMGEVEVIKEKTQQVGKFIAIGAGVLGGVWLLTKAFGGKKDKVHRGQELGPDSSSRRSARTLRKGRATANGFDLDDNGFGGRRHQADHGQQAPASQRAHLAPDVYHTDNYETDDSDPFRPLGFDSPRAVPAVRPRAQAYDSGRPEGPSLVSETFRAFLQSDTGKMLVAQTTAVLMAVVAKKMGDYLPMFKNPDLASSPTREPETRDIDFTFHDDDAHAPHQPL